MIIIDLIDTYWNVNKGKDGLRSGIVRFNRYIVECK